MRRSSEKVSLREVAAAAGVSVVTVSAALNGGGRVSDGRRDAIRLLAKEMGYQPNAAARLLKTKKIADIGLLIFEREELIRQNAQFLDITVQFMRECSRLGIHFQQEWFDCSRNPERLPQLLTNGLVGGLVIGGVPSGASADYIESELRLPYVRLDEPGPYSVMYDVSGPIRECIYYLANLGHRRIGLINSDERLIQFSRVRQGFDAALREIKLDPAEAFYLTAPAFGELSGQIRELVDRVLEAGPQRPSAILINSGLSAKAFISELASRGVRVPEDVSVVCFATVDWEVAQFCPPITALEHNFEGIVVTGIAMLRQLMEGRKITRPNVTVPTVFTKRQTVTVPAKNSES